MEMRWVAKELAEAGEVDLYDYEKEHSAMLARQEEIAKKEEAAKARQEAAKARYEAAKARQEAAKAREEKEKEEKAVEEKRRIERKRKLEEKGEKKKKRQDIAFGAKQQRELAKYKESTPGGFHLGQRIECRYKERNMWWPGTLKSSGNVPGTWNVAYLDGEVELDVRARAPHTLCEQRDAAFAAHTLCERKDAVLAKTRCPHTCVWHTSLFSHVCG